MGCLLEIYYASEFFKELSITWVNSMRLEIDIKQNLWKEQNPTPTSEGPVRFQYKCSGSDLCIPRNETMQPRSKTEL